MNATTKTAPRQRKKPARFCKLTRQGACRFLSIRQVLTKDREQLDAYDLLEIGADTGRGFRLTKPNGKTYCVSVSGEQESCECKGHLQRGHRTVCKHRAALAKLIALGKL
ncbi:MAG: hypothetical protein HYS12_11830 [Planctomycetes bacterium]|nr:hypothetical protein [Planctomycetota bacterium]